MIEVGVYNKPKCVSTLSWISIGLALALSGSDILYTEEVSASFKAFLAVMQMGAVPFIFIALWAAIGGSKEGHSTARMIIFVILNATGFLEIFLTTILFRILSVSEYSTMAKLSAYMNYAKLLPTFGHLALAAALSIDVYESSSSGGFGS